MKLSPFVDSDGILRVGGRLANSELTFGEKRPIILPQKGQFTELLIRQGHLIFFFEAEVMLNRKKENMLKAINNEVATYIENEGIRWNFIPPASPNFGGLWEAGAKSTKFHLKRVIDESRLTFEEVSTLLAQIEACLNSRPICEMTPNPEDITPLTPGHFLVGGNLLTVPEPAEIDLNVHPQNRWHLIELMHQSFWRRWSSEYLSRLQRRPKSNRKQRNFQVGDLVLLKDESLPPSQWLLGRIINTHPGTDNVVRVVTLKTKDATLKRSVAKICFLPIEDADSSVINDSTT